MPYVLGQTSPNPTWLLPPGKWETIAPTDWDKTEDCVTVEFGSMRFRYKLIDPNPETHTNPTLNDHGPELNRYYKENLTALDAGTS